MGADELEVTLSETWPSPSCLIGTDEVSGEQSGETKEAKTV